MLLIFWVNHAYRCRDFLPSLLALLDTQEGKTDILGQEVRVTMASQAKKAAEEKILGTT